MKTIIRTIGIYTLILFFLPSIIPGVKIEGGAATLFTAGVALAIMFLILKPILNIISFPVNIITLGLFSIFTNVLIIYLLTVFIPDVTVDPFTYAKTEAFGFITPKISFNTFFAYLYTAFILSFIDSFIKWLIK